MVEYIFFLLCFGCSSSASLGFFYSWGGYLWIVAVGLATVASYRWFGFDTERGLLQSLILITCAFLVLRGQVNEQYALYLYALALIDVALWSPQRRRLVLASIAAVLLYHLSNDVLL